MATSLARDVIKRVPFAVSSSARRWLVDMISTTLPFKPPPERRDIDEINGDKNNNDGEAACRSPEGPLSQCHITDVRGVHAEDTCDERQGQEYHGDDREHYGGIFAPVLYSGDLGSSLLPCQNSAT